MMKRKQKILFSTLLGLVLPLGNIIGPLLVKCEDLEQRLYRRYVVKSEIVITSMYYILGVALVLKVHFFSEVHGSISDTWRWGLFFGFWAMILLFALINALLLRKKNV